MAPLVQSCTTSTAECNDVVDSAPISLGILAIVVVALVVLIVIGSRRFSE